VIKRAMNTMALKNLHTALWNRIETMGHFITSAQHTEFSN